MTMSIKASPDGTYGEILVNGAVVAKLPVTGNAVIPNLVGTVSQSGGVPTGAIIERGSNANGEYVRYADGTQICTYAISVGPWLANSAASAVWIFPAAFSAIPRPYANSNTAYPHLYAASSVASSASQSEIYFGGSVSTFGVAIVLAIGRWF